MFYSALLGATLPARALEQGFNLFQSVSSQTNTHYWYIVPLVSVCSSQHGLKQIKLCFNSRAGCEAALRSDGRLCLQSFSISVNSWLVCGCPAVDPANWVPLAMSDSTIGTSINYCKSFYAILLLFHVIIMSSWGHNT